MRQAITTKYLGPTNHRGARIKASAQAGSVTVSWDHSMSPQQNHVEAARALALVYGWDGVWIGGALPHGTGYAFVLQAACSFGFELGDGTGEESGK